MKKESAVKVLKKVRFNSSESLCNEYKNFFYNSPTIMMILSTKGEILDVSRKVKEFTGYDNEVLKGLKLYELPFLDKDSSKEIKKKFILRNHNQKLKPYDLKIIDKKGRELYLNVLGSLLNDNKKKPRRVYLTLSDVTLRRTAEQELIREKEWSQKVINSAPDIIIALGRRSKILLFNKYAEKITGYKKEEVLGKEWISLFVPNNLQKQVYKVWDEIMNKRHENHSYTNPIITKKGRERIILWNNTFLKREDKEYVVLSLGTDITERKMNEKALEKYSKKLEKSLMHKDILLKELHHRVKNNMQIIISLLNLQASYSKDDNLKKLFNDSQDRILSMALVHELLYKSKDLQFVNFNKYAKKLVGKLVKSYNIKGRRLKTIINIKNVSLGLEESIHLGIILNELVSNALKHGLIDEKSGVLEVRLEKKGRNCSLIVYNTGRVFDKSINVFSPKTFGLGLVNTMVNQINGEMKVHYNNGTTFKIDFSSE